MPTRPHAWHHDDAWPVPNHACRPGTFCRLPVPSFKCFLLPPQTRPPVPCDILQCPALCRLTCVASSTAGSSWIPRCCRMLTRSVAVLTWRRYISFGMTIMLGPLPQLPGNTCMRGRVVVRWEGDDERTAWQGVQGALATAQTALHGRHADGSTPNAACRVVLCHYMRMLVRVVRAPACATATATAPAADSSTASVNCTRENTKVTPLKIRQEITDCQTVLLMSITAGTR